MLNSEYKSRDSFKEANSWNSFKKFDENKDGKINLNEIKKLDTDGDGVLSDSEFENTGITSKVVQDEITSKIPNLKSKINPVEVVFITKQADEKIENLKCKKNECLTPSSLSLKSKNEPNHRVSEEIHNKYLTIKSLLSDSVTFNKFENVLNKISNKSEKEINSFLDKSLTKLSTEKNKTSENNSNSINSKLSNKYKHPTTTPPAPSPNIDEINMQNLKKDFPKISFCIDKLSTLIKSKDKIEAQDISKLRKELGSSLNLNTKLTFEQKWVSNLLNGLGSNISNNQKDFIDNLKHNITSESIKNGLLNAKTDPILREFKGDKKKVFQEFLENYYTDPMLLNGLNNSVDYSYLSGASKNFSQALKFETEENDLKSSFGSCQDLQRKIGDMMQGESNFTKYFDIEKYAQLSGAHNFVIFTDKETKKEYQADPWYKQKLQDSIKLRDFIH
ncbi:MAG: hypothetical protein AABZ74_08685 [Cyanobacteriota bacterium]